MPLGPCREPSDTNVTNGHAALREGRGSSKQHVRRGGGATHQSPPALGGCQPQPQRQLFAHPRGGAAGPPPAAVAGGALPVRQGGRALLQRPLPGPAAAGDARRS